MSNKGKANKSVKTGIIVLIILVLIASSTIVIVFGANKLKNSDSTNIQPAGNELYMLALPGPDPINDTSVSDTLENFIPFVQGLDESKFPIKALNETTSFYYMKPGSQHNFSINDTLYVYAYILNKDQKELNCSILAYQCETDYSNNTFNYARLFYGHIEPIPGYSNRKVTFQIKLDHVSDNSYLGIALLDGPDANSSEMSNYTDIKVTVN